MAIATVGNYELLEAAGRGAMAKVYRGRHTFLGDQVAVKILNESIAGDLVFQERLLREARAIKDIDHPNVVRLIDFGRTPDGASYLVTEWLEGRTLRDLMDRTGPLDEAFAIGAARQIAQALAAVHDAGFVHRDLKPANVMITLEGTVKVLDFGLVGDDTSERLTQTGAVVGTAFYMAPEMIMKRGATGATDLYALGAVLHEMLTGAVPYPGDSLQLIWNQHMRADVPLIDGMWGPLIQALLAKSPDNRPAGASEVAAMLEGVVDMLDLPTLSSGRGLQCDAPPTVVVPRPLDGGAVATTDYPGDVSTTAGAPPTASYPGEPSDQTDLPLSPAPVSAPPSVRAPIAAFVVLGLAVAAVVGAVAYRPDQPVTSRPMSTESTVAGKIAARARPVDPADPGDIDVGDPVGSAHAGMRPLHDSAGAAPAVPAAAEAASDSPGRVPTEKNAAPPVVRRPATSRRQPAARSVADRLASVQQRLRLSVLQLELTERDAATAAPSEMKRYRSAISAGDVDAANTAAAEIEAALGSVPRLRKIIDAKLSDVSAKLRAVVGRLSSTEAGQLERRYLDLSAQRPTDLAAARRLIVAIVALERDVALGR